MQELELERGGCRLGLFHSQAHVFPYNGQFALQRVRSLARPARHRRARV